MQDEAEAYVANLLRMRGVNLSGASRDILRAPEQSGRNLLRTPDMSYLSLKADSIPRKMNEGSLTPRLRTNEEMLQSLRYHHAKVFFNQSQHIYSFYTVYPIVLYGLVGKQC